MIRERELPMEEEKRSPKIATVILARKGSRRIPYKNIVPFKGRPLIEWTLQTAWKLGHPVWVFTDMPEVRRLASLYHANVRDKLFESEDGHHQTDKELAKYNEEMKADVIVFLQATSPERDIEDVAGWINLFITSECDVGMSVVPMRPGFYYDHTGKALNYRSDDRDYNSNVKTEVYLENGSFYIFRASQIGKNHFTNSDKRMLFLDKFGRDVDDWKDIYR